MQQFDGCIVGSGLSGVLVAARLVQHHPGKKFALIDRDERSGGRLRSTDEKLGRWGYGLSSLSMELYHNIDTLLKQNPVGPDLAEFGIKQLEHYGVLSAGKISLANYTEASHLQGARALAGAAAAKEWSVVDELLAEDRTKDAAFGNVWPLQRKSPAALVLEHLARAWGVNELWTAPTQLVLNRMHQARIHQYSGPWELVLDAILDSLQESVNFIGSSLVAHAERREQQWILQTEKGIIKAPLLVVAQSPWEAMNWLDKSFWPQALIPLATKAKPVSLVVLTEQWHSGDGPPDLLLVPAEEVQVRSRSGCEICYQVTIDYEMTMQAPNVVKAVRRLRRARTKVHAALPGLVAAGEHLALLPVGWTQIASQHERRWVDKLESKPYQQPHLVFVGDAYGVSDDGELNLLRSVDAACEIARF